MKRNKRVEQVKQALRQPSTFPGMYPLAFITHDGAMCPTCVRNNFRGVVNDTRQNRGCYNVTIDVIWEGEIQCVECEAGIPTAYGPVE